MNTLILLKKRGRKKVEILGRHDILEGKALLGTSVEW